MCSAELNAQVQELGGHSRSAASEIWVPSSIFESDHNNRPELVQGCQGLLGILRWLNLCCAVCAQQAAVFIHTIHHALTMQLRDALDRQHPISTFNSQLVGDRDMRGHPILCRCQLYRYAITNKPAQQVLQFVQSRLSDPRGLSLSRPACHGVRICRDTHHVAQVFDINMLSWCLAVLRFGKFLDTATAMGDILLA